MATIFSSGLETETDAFTTEWDSKTVNGSNSLTVTSESGKFHAGSKGAKTVTDVTSNTAYAYKAFTEGTEFYCRWYVKLPSGFSYNTAYATPVYMCLLDGTTGIAYANIRADAAMNTFHAQFKVRHSGGLSTVYQGATDSFSVGDWHYVEMRWKKGTGADGGLECRLDGAVLDTEFDKDCTAYDVDGIRCGVSDATNITDAQELYWDDVKVTDDAYPGALAATTDGDFYLFEEFAADFGNGVHDLANGGHTIKAALINDTLAPTRAATAEWATFSGNEVSGTGYTAGGATLANQSYTEVGGVATFDADDVSWSLNAAGPEDARYLILYNDSASNDECIGYMDLGQDRSLRQGDINIAWASVGILRFTYQDLS